MEILTPKQIMEEKQRSFEEEVDDLLLACQQHLLDKYDENNFKVVYYTLENKNTSKDVIKTVIEEFNKAGWQVDVDDTVGTSLVFKAREETCN